MTRVEIAWNTGHIEFFEAAREPTILSNDGWVAIVLVNGGGSMLVSPFQCRYIKAYGAKSP